MTIKNFCVSTAKRTDRIGEISRKILNYDKQFWRSSEYEKKFFISTHLHKKFSNAELTEWFNLLNKSEYER